MAVKYVRSTTGSDANGGTSWADAYATIGKALTVVAAGDTVYVSQVHAETQASALTWTGPGTVNNPVRILCVNDGATPPTAMATGATVSTTGANDLTLGGSGHNYVEGIVFQGGSGAVTANINVGTTPTGTMTWVLRNCGLKLVATGSVCRINIGESSGARPCLVILDNTPMTFTDTGQFLVLGAARFVWRNTPSALAGTIPTTLLRGGNGSFALGQFSGLDLSAMGSGRSLVDVTNAAFGGMDVYFRNCKLGASVTAINGAIMAPGAINVYLENCDSANTNYRMEHYKYQGSIVQETTKVRSGGASDGTTALSHKFVSLATGPSLFTPLDGPLLTAWNDTSGSSKTVTVEFLHDSLTSLQNSDIYLEVEYPGTSSFPESVYANNRVADVFATPANCPAGVGTGSWTTSGMTNPNSQKLQVTFAPQSKGPVRARVYLIKSNYSVYVDPLMSIA